MAEATEALKYMTLSVFGELQLSTVNTVGRLYKESLNSKDSMIL